MQISIYQIDSLGRYIPIEYTPSTHSMYSFFVEGNPVFITILTVFLIALLFAAWKAPQWVREIGIGTAVLGCIFSLIAFYQMSESISVFGDSNPAVVFSGFRCVLLPSLYGLMIDFLSLVIRIIQKPRI